MPSSVTVRLRKATYGTVSQPHPGSFGEVVASFDADESAAAMPPVRWSGPGSETRAGGGRGNGRPPRPSCLPGNGAIPAPTRLDARKPNNRCTRMEGFTALMSGTAGAIKRGNEGSWGCR